MSFVRLAWARFAATFRKRHLDLEFDEEVRSHIDLATEDYVRRGALPAEAHRMARLKFGAVAAAKDAHRDSRGLTWLEGIFYDLRFAVRGLRRDRGFTLAAIAMLALAIGLNVTVFTVMDAMLFRGFPLVKRNDRLVFLQEHDQLGRCCMSFPDFEDWRTQARTLQGMAVVGGRRFSFRDGGGRSIDTSAWTLSANAFSLLGVPPLLGRDFVPADEIPGAAPVVILNYRFWESWFGKRMDVVGSTVHIDGAPATIIGVMPERFDFPIQGSANMWMTIAHTPELQQRGLTPGGFVAIARLRDGVSLTEALAELETINRRLEAAYPATNRGLVPTMVTHAEFTSGPNASIIWGSLWAAAWFVFLIACANLANLTMARTVGRWREVSTRIALGAGQGRMMRQIFVESLALVTVAGAIGWWITQWSVRAWAVKTASRMQTLDYSVDSGTFAYLVAITLAAAILFSVAPIAAVWRLGLNGVLKADARGLTQSLRGKYFAATLVVGQMALAIVLLSGSGVLVRSLMNIVHAKTGVRDPEHILVGSTRLPSDKYPSPAAQTAYFERLEAQLRAVPGIESESVSSQLPVYGINTRALQIEGRLSAPAGEDAVQFVTAAPDYFHVLGASILSGRDFNRGDQPGSLPVAIVNQSFVRRFWPDDPPVGKRLRPMNQNQPGEWRTVVGVVPDILQGDATRQTFKPLVYTPLRQQPLARAFFLARTSVPPERVAQGVLAAVQKLDPDVLLTEFTTLKGHLGFDRDYMDLEHSELGKHASVAPVFAVIALLLSAIGLYAVIAHSVNQRTKEIGIRMAIGAGAEDIRRLIFREGMTPVVVGSFVGLVASLGVNRILQSQLVGVSPYDPVTLIAAPVILALVALIACQIPSRRAVRVDPVVALRQD